MAFIEPKKKGFFGRLSEKIGNVILDRATVDDDLLDDIEEILITSDIGMETTLKIMEQLRIYVRENSVWNPADVPAALTKVVAQVCDKGHRNRLTEETPLVLLMVGVNGGGKTTSIAKIAHRLQQEGKTVLLAAADTFRAAAAEQLSIWGQRTGTAVIKHQEGADPSAVIFDAIQAAKARGVDVLICDTAGRLQAKKNLMDELEKMNRIISREYPEAARETLLVLDATTGKNAISQAEVFNEAAELTGLILTKLDGTAKGGIAVTITDEYDIPIKFIGVGEGMDDLEVFDPESFAGGICSEE